MRSQFSLLAAALRALLAAGGLMFLLGPLLLPEQLGSPHLSLAGLGLLLGLVLHAGLRPGRRAGEYVQVRRDASGGEHLQRRGTEARACDLLDLHSNVILERDAQGRLTYVNRAFCDAFDVRREDVLGTDFAPAVLDQDGPEMHADGPEGHPKRSFTQRLETRSGPRWITWEEHTSPVPGTAGSAMLRIGRDVTDERAVAAMLAQSREQAEEESRQAAQLLTSLSHDVRSRVEAICYLSSRLMATPQALELKRHTEAIHDTARALREVIHQAIELSDIEAGRAKIELAHFNLENCVQEVAELAASKAYQKGLELGWTLEPGVPDGIAGDEARIRLILLNLLHCAIEATSRGGVLMMVALSPPPAEQVRVAIRIEGTSRELEPDGSLQLLISRRLANIVGGHVAVEGGPQHVSALTLALPLPLDAGTGSPTATEHNVVPVRALICSSLRLEAQALAAELKLVGADVTVTESAHADSAISRVASPSEGFDLVFVDGATSPELAAVLLACANEQSPEGRTHGCVLVTGRQVEQLDAFRVAGVDNYLVRPVRRSSLRGLLGLRKCAEAHAKDVHPSQPHDDVQPAVSRPGRHVLIAEDNPINARLTQCMVRRAGCTATLVETGRAAVEAVRNSLKGKGPAIDLVLMDIHMPDLDGIAAARELRSLSDWPLGPSATARSCPPLIAITANAFAEDRHSCLAAGMDDYLAKPFTWPEFQAVLARWLPSIRYSGTTSDSTHRAA